MFTILRSADMFSSPWEVMHWSHLGNGQCPAHSRHNILAVLESYSPDLTDVISRMLERDPLKRISAKVVFNSKPLGHLSV